MSEILRCPSCGQPNPADSRSCSACNFPLRGPDRPAAGGAPPAAPEREIRIQRPLPHRPRRRPGSNQQLTLWLLFATLAAAAVVYMGISANLRRSTPPVEGANPEVQKRVDELRAALESDSTNLDARQALADVLYDTANWTDAIVQYRSVVRQDSSRVTAIVDLGVCYYNLGDVREARRHFLLGLAREPHHPIALFNLGTVSEREGDLEAALDYYHRALQSGPPPGVQQALTEAIQRTQQRLGRGAPPLAPGSGSPAGR
jgi:tetratricopeptide (TPR) repeat protein